MKKTVLYLVLFISFLLSQQNVNAQGGDYITDGHGKPFQSSNTDVDGSPFLIDNWLPGKVITVKGKVYDKVKLKYELNGDFPIFIYNNNDEALKFAEDVKSFILYTPEAVLFTSGFPPVDKQTEASFYKVLSDGKVKLLKHFSRHVIINKGYSSVDGNKVYRDINNYYIFKEGKIQKVDNPQKILYSMAGTHKNKIDAFMKVNSYNWKEDEGLGRVFDFYNTLGN
ncbi:hypothetical protein [Mucilaginibacter terrae]|uniref:DUF4369 domain-containing protein n=1 Tax=Mucilaginibacter terrae TaxID=1955052 RepID=A0ABU3GU30_9SPHI|nr:hypothetical protein [Mucilaginibacter terrae]MDT3403291.1 hypothetical protein [Mucilaginibacter terrae]